MYINLNLNITYHKNKNSIELRDGPDGRDVSLLSPATQSTPCDSDQIEDAPSNGDVDAFVELQSDGGGAGGGRRRGGERGEALHSFAPGVGPRHRRGRLQRSGARLVGPRLAARGPPLGAGSASVGRLRPLRRTLLHRQLPDRHRLPGAAHLRRVPVGSMGFAPGRLRRQPGRARRPFGAAARGGAGPAQDAALRVREGPAQGHLRPALLQDRRLRQAVAHTVRGAKHHFRREFVSFMTVAAFRGRGRHDFHSRDFT